MLDIESKTCFVTKPVFCLVKEKFDWNIYLIFFSATRNVCFFSFTTTGKAILNSACFFSTMRQNMKSCWDIPFKMIKIMARLPLLTHPSESTYSLSDYITVITYR